MWHWIAAAIDRPLRQRRLRREHVRSLGEAASATRTADQTQIARFWLENTPMSWQRIAVKLATERRLNGWDQVRLSALLQMAPGPV
jgi:hypothetical protein